MLRSLLLAAASTVIASTTLAQPMPSGLSPQRQALWKEIRAVNDSMEAAFKRGDMKAVAGFYTDDAKMTGGGPIVSGRAAMDEAWKRIGATPGTWKLEVFEVGGSRELAYQRGKSTLTQAEPGGTPRVSIVEFVVIWRREPNGALRMWMDLY
jgi:ketosteroid isomerase-like protein